MDATVHSAVSNLDGSSTEGGVLAGQQNLIWILTPNLKGHIVSAKVSANTALSPAAQPGSEHLYQAKTGLAYWMLKHAGLSYNACNSSWS